VFVVGLANGNRGGRLTGEAPVPQPTEKPQARQVFGRPALLLKDSVPTGSRLHMLSRRESKQAEVSSAKWPNPEKGGRKACSTFDAFLLDILKEKTHTLLNV